MAALAEQVEVELAQRRQEPVGIADHLAVAVGQQHLVAGVDRRGLGAAQLEQPGRVDLAQRAALTAALAQQRHLRRAGVAEADEPAAVGLCVGTQQPVGIGVGAGEEGGELRVQRRHPARLGAEPRLSVAGRVADASPRVGGRDPRWADSGKSRPTGGAGTDRCWSGLSARPRASARQPPNTWETHTRPSAVTTTPMPTWVKSGLTMLA